MYVYWISQQPHLVMTSSVINPKSNKADIIDGAMEYIDITDRQIKRQKEINLFLFWCLGVVSVYALLF